MKRDLWGNLNFESESDEKSSVWDIRFGKWEWWKVTRVGNSFLKVRVKMRTKRRRSVCVGLQKSLKHGQIARTRECTRRTFETQEGDTLTWGNIWRASGVSKMFVNVFSDRSVRLRPQMVERMLENDKKWDADTCSMITLPDHKCGEGKAIGRLLVESQRTSN